MDNWYLKSVDEILKHLDTKKEGISANEVENRLKKYGFNEIKEDKKDSVTKLLVNQFKSFIIIILGISALISILIGHRIEFFVILLIIIFVIILNFFMEFKAARDMEALIKLAPRICAVIRDGKKLIIPSREVVVGDILYLTQGYTVGADARVIESESLSVDESMLTGESVSVLKETIELVGIKSVSEQKNMVFSGTHITNGHGLAVVIRTGANTEFGSIGKLIIGIKHQTTPLQERIEKLTKQIAIFAIFLSVLAFIFGLLHGNPWASMLIFSMAIIVSGIPESLPTVIGVTLAAGVKRMAKQNAIIKRLPAVETLGSCTVICTDKTGTLTQNKMVIEQIFTYDSEINVTGQGYNPEGLFFKENEKIDAEKHKTLLKILEIGILCNNSELKRDNDEWVIDGEPTEGALIVLARKAGMMKLEYHTKYERKKEHPFNSNRKMMSTIHLFDNKHFVYSKGAPERVLENAKYYLHNDKIKILSDEVKEKFIKKNEEYSAKGLRVIALAYKNHSGSFEDIKNIESDLIFVGIVSIKDPLNLNIKESILKCKEAGIKVVMITGDNPITAKSIASEIGIYTHTDKILTGKELDELNEDDFYDIVESISVYARVTPEHKLRIVQTLQRKGHIVAMTGDGVNDAPALKKADIGVAMGRGSEVAKESAELILKDNNFNTIVNAIESGRTIYENIRKFIYYLLVGSISEVLLILIAVMIGFNLPLTALMILFVNLVTSEFPALGLGFEKPSKDIMKQKPRDTKEGILSPFLITRIFEIVPILILGTMSLFIWEMFTSSNYAKAQTIVFATIILFELFHVFNAKSWNNSIFNKEFFSNKYVFIGVISAFLATLTVIYSPTLQPIFGTTSLNIYDWLIILPVSLSIIFFVEIKKLILKIEIREYEKVKNHNHLNQI